MDFYCNPVQVIKDFQFDWRYMLRGLTIDKKRGNILKIDRHKYVKLAHHGFVPLSQDQRLSTYNAAEVRQLTPGPRKTDCASK